LAAPRETSRRFGLPGVMRGALVSMAAAIALLAVAPGTLPLAYASTALFGSTYIALTGALLVWSVDVFREKPSAGLGAAFLLIAVGQLAGSPAAGGYRGGNEPGSGLLRVRTRGSAHRPGEAAHRRPRRFRARPLRRPADGAPASAADRLRQGPLPIHGALPASRAPGLPPRPVRGSRPDARA